MIAADSSTETRMDATHAAAWTRLTADALIAGLVGTAFADSSIGRLESDGFFGLADSLRTELAARRSLLRSRGFVGVR